MKLPIVNWQTLSLEQKRTLLRRPVQVHDTIVAQKVRDIVHSVKTEGDSAVFAFTQKFDRVALESFRVTDSEIKRAYKKVDASVLEALRVAIRTIGHFHEAQLPRNLIVETAPGVHCERRYSPIPRVGLYVPSGTAPLPSTVLMLGVPSRIAGCPQRVLVSPPQSDGSIDPTILAAADMVGIREIFKVGGAQAIAALAYGTETIPKVDKIFGPGNSWVTEAKSQVAQDPDGAVCDMPAGPSEVMVIADRFADPEFVAADLLSQAEHGGDSQVLCLSDSETLLTKIRFAIERQVEKLSRKEIALQALTLSSLILVPDMAEALTICQSYAPEHLILQIQHPRHLADQVTNAGSIFLGPWSPESMGDYASGTNHVLPTCGYARAVSGLGTENFMKSYTVQELTREGFVKLAPTVQALASVEGLDAHRNAVDVRMLRGTL